MSHLNLKRKISIILIVVVAVFAIFLSSNNDRIGGRTESFWSSVGNYIKTTSPLGYNVLINGTNKYLNFNALSGESGYGFRDNAGSIEYKDSGGAWAGFSAGSMTALPDTQIYVGNASNEATATSSVTVNSAGTLSASGGTSLEWTTAYGWGDHSTEGYYSSTTNGQINGLSEDANPYIFSQDVMLFEDASDSFSKKKIIFGNLLNKIAGSLTFLSLSDWFATTTHENLANLPALKRYFTFTISTSTQDYLGNPIVAGATSTVRYIAPYPQTIDYIGYKTSAGTAGINMGDGTNWSGYKSAGTTFASSTTATNNSFTQGESWDFQVNLSGASTVLNINGQLTTD